MRRSFITTTVRGYNAVIAKTRMRVVKFESLVPSGLEFYLDLTCFRD